MKYLKISLLFFCALFCISCYSQEPSIATDSILVKLTVTTLGEKKLETTVNFENSATHKIKSFKTNKEGKADCVLYTDQNYVVKIPESDDSYEYSIPDFSISPVKLTFKFGLREK
ncbi:MAG: hypothetical protein ABI741_08130 [Ferruginibacter sp.]